MDRGYVLCYNILVLYIFTRLGPTLSKFPEGAGGGAFNVFKRSAVTEHEVSDSQTKNWTPLNQFTWCTKNDLFLALHNMYYKIIHIHARH